MYFSVNITGGAELEKKLKALEPKIAKKLVKKVLRDAAKAVASRAKSNAMSVVGGEMGNLIAKNIIVRAGKRQRKGSYIINAMINPDEESFIHTTKDGTRHYIPSAIEYGHTYPYQGGSGSKDVPAIPFMRPAFDETKELALKIIENGIRQAVEGNQ